MCIRDSGNAELQYSRYTLCNIWYLPEENVCTHIIYNRGTQCYKKHKLVGLLPIAVSGCDIDKMMQGAADARKAYCDEDLDKNDCYK